MVEVSLDTALGVVDGAYAAAHGETGWEGALTGLADMLGHQAATLEFHNVADSSLLHMQYARIDPASFKTYADDFVHLNPRADYLRTSRAEIVHDRLILSERGMDQHPFYAAFLKPHGLRYFLALHSQEIDGYAKGVISLQRSGKESGLDAHTLSVFEALAPHLKRALAVYWARHRSQIDPDYFDRALALAGLTGAERRLARALAFGETPPEYARRTGVSINTAYTHFRRIKSKLECKTQRQLSARLQEIAH